MVHTQSQTDARVHTQLTTSTRLTHTRICEDIQKRDSLIQAERCVQIIRVKSKRIVEVVFQVFGSEKHTFTSDTWIIASAFHLLWPRKFATETDSRFHLVSPCRTETGKWPSLPTLAGTTTDRAPFGGILTPLVTKPQPYIY